MGVGGTWEKQCGVKLKRQKFGLNLGEVLLWEVYLSPVHMCLYVYKGPYCTLQHSVGVKSLDSRARLLVSKCYHLFYFSVPSFLD